MASRIPTLPSLTSTAYPCELEEMLNTAHDLITFRSPERDYLALVRMMNTRRLQFVSSRFISRKVFGLGVKIC